jgi:eukaryotic-like serine/threonine-protein kinase
MPLLVAGQQLGPFTIERELGSGAMGTVYRARYKNEQVLAVKVMSQSTGGTSASATDRFAREAEILKQLRHPNVVRLFGVGKHAGMRYYAMELIEGESLDKVMARRDRLAWEEVVDLGTQLCSALQYVHERGIIHRDLKPSNLMILRDGTLKLTDFGIAKDLDVTALTQTNCTVGTAAYMSPEQCRGEMLTNKSDLYSLGVVFYELVTGQKPFRSENAMQMFLLHCEGKVERPSRLVADLPVWMDNLICQLLEKKPDLRPLSAATVAASLAEIVQKVETLRSAGVDAATARRGDVPKAQRKVSEEDRDVIRTIKGKKKGKKKPEQSGGVAKTALQAGGLLVLLAGVVIALVVALQPPSANTLYQRAEKLMRSDKGEDRDKGRDGPVREYLRSYGALGDKQTEQVKLWADDYDAGRAEGMLEKHINHERTGRGVRVGTNNEAEETAMAAAWTEYEGNAEKATSLWKKVREKWEQEGGHAADALRVDLVADRHLKYLGALKDIDTQFAAHYDNMIKKSVPPPLEQLAAKAFDAWRYAQLKDWFLARKGYEEVKEAALKDAAMRPWLVYAAIRSRDANEHLEENSKWRDIAERQKNLDAQLAAIENDVETDHEHVTFTMAKNRYDNFLALYEKNGEMTEQVKKAKQLRRKYLSERDK